MSVDPSSLEARWASLSASEIIREASAIFGDTLVMSSHCNGDSALTLHVVTSELPSIKVIYLEDPETVDFSHQLEGYFGLKFQTFKKRGDKLTAMQGALGELGARAVLHGIRAYQTPLRAQKKIIELGADGFYRIHPILSWTREEVDEYMKRYSLPYHKPPVVEAKTECGLHCFVQA